MREERCVRSTCRHPARAPRKRCLKCGLRCLRITDISGMCTSAFVMLHIQPRVSLHSDLAATLPALVSGLCTLPHTRGRGSSGTLAASVLVGAGSRQGWNPGEPTVQAAAPYMAGIMMIAMNSSVRRKGGAPAFNARGWLTRDTRQCGYHLRAHRARTPTQKVAHACPH